MKTPLAERRQPGKGTKKKTAPDDERALTGDLLVPFRVVSWIGLIPGQARRPLARHFLVLISRLG